MGKKRRYGNGETGTLLFGGKEPKGKTPLAAESKKRKKKNKKNTQ